MDFFAILGQGSKFNKAKFNTQKFEAPSKDIVIKELDFFNDNTEEIEKVEKKVNSSNNDENEEEEIASSISNQEEAKIWQKSHNIKVYGSDVPFPSKSFNELCERFKFKTFLKRNLSNLGFKKPTPIQMQAIPIMLHGRDVMSCSPTGSGKTLAFLVPILHELKGPTKEGFRAVIISPTRELAQQVHNSNLDPS